MYSPCHMRRWKIGMNEIFVDLCQDTIYAIRSNDKTLIYECYGALKMAKRLGGINKEEYDRLHRVLIPGWANNVAHREELAKTITWEQVAGGLDGTFKMGS